MKLENKHFKYVHVGFLVYIIVFAVLLVVYAVSSIIENRLGFPNFFFYVIIVGAGLFLYDLHKKWEKMLKITYRKLLMEKKVQIIVAAVVSLVLLVIQTRLSSIVFLLLYFPQIIFDMLLFPMANFFPFKAVLLVVFAPLKILVEVLYVYFVVSLITKLYGKLSTLNKK